MCISGTFLPMYYDIVLSLWRISVLASLPIEISKTDDQGAGQETCVHVLAYIQQHVEV